jgi:hypothetical protein
MKTIIIFGGGIAGLTVAHELIEKKFNVIVIEKDNILGGMARSQREKYNIPSEHSWRGYAPFYNNTFDIMKRIPLTNNKNKTVYDNLSLPITFYSLRDKVYEYKSNLNIIDYFWIGYFLLKYNCSNNRKNIYYKIKLIDIFKNKLSEDAYKYLVDFVCGPGYGMEKKDASYAHYFKGLTMGLYNQSVYSHTHTSINGQIYKTKSSDKWHVMNQPTNEAWFDHWEKYLIDQGVIFYKNTKLTKLNISNNKITSCVLNNSIVLQANEYILCINPFNAEQLFASNNQFTNLHQQHYMLNLKTDSRQVAFRLGFNKKIKFPIENIAFVFPDSEFNITLYPQEKSWKADIKLDDMNRINSLWSGTILELYRTSKIYNKPGLNLTKEELMNEIIYQILRSKSLQKLIFDNNNFYLGKSDIFYTEIWYEWEYTNGNLDQINKKWITNIYNQKFRPDAKTQIENLYIGGSHGKTSIEIWSMEGAVESGKNISNLILTKYNLPKTYIHKHQDPNYFKIFKFIDDILYKLNLPNIIDVVILILIYLLLHFFTFQTPIIY